MPMSEEKRGNTFTSQQYGTNGPFLKFLLACNITHQKLFTNPKGLTLKFQK